MKARLWFLIVTGVYAFSGYSADLPKWLQDWKVKGDLRLRYEGLDFDRAGRENRHRGRFRFRIAADKKINEKLAFKLRLASGSGDPTSTNQSFDNSFSGKDLLIDRVYLTYAVADWQIGAGKVANPFHTTDMVWDSDVNPEGAYGKYGKGHFYAVIGGFLVEEESSAGDINLVSGQAGIKGGEAVKYKFSGAYYFYEQPIADYEFIDVVGTLAFGPEHFPTELSFDFVKNTSNQVENNDTAWAVYADFGGGKPGDWSFGLKYAEIEAFSVLGLFADSDFGFADKEGFSGSAAYRSSKATSWKLTVFSVDSILAVDEGFQRVQLDFSLKF